MFQEDKNDGALKRYTQRAEEFRQEETKQKMLGLLQAAQQKYWKTKPLNKLISLDKASQINSDLEPKETNPVIDKILSKAYAGKEEFQPLRRTLTAQEK